MIGRFVASLLLLSVLSFCLTAFAQLPDISVDPSAMTEKEQREYEQFKRAVERYTAEAKFYKEGVGRIVMSEYQRKLSSVDGVYESKIKALRSEEAALRLNVIQRMEAFLERYGDEHERAAEVLYRLAKLHYEESEESFLMADDAENPDFSKTLYYIASLKKNFPQFDQMDGAYYLEGFCRLQMGQEEESKDVFLALAESYPKSSKRAEAFTRVGEYYFARSQEAIQGFGSQVQWDKALYYYNEAIKLGKDSSVYDRALYRKAWTEYYTEDYDGMIKDFIALVDYADESPQGSALRGEAIEFMAVALAEEDWDLSDTVSVDPDFGMRRFDKYLHTGKDFETEVLRAYADTLVEQSRFDHASEAYEAYLARNTCSPDNPKIARVYIASLNMSGQRDKAAYQQANLEQRFGRDSEWYKCQEREGNLEALAFADSTVLLAFKDSIATYYEKMVEAESIYKTAAIDSEDEQLSVEERREARKDMEFAHRSFIETNLEISRLTADLLRRFPEDEEAYIYRYMMAEAYFNSMQYEKAALTFAEIRDFGAGRYRRSAANGAIEARSLYIAELTHSDKDNVYGLEPAKLQEAFASGVVGTEFAPSYIVRSMAKDGKISEDKANAILSSRATLAEKRALTPAARLLVEDRDKYVQLELDKEKAESDEALNPIYRYFNALVFYNYGQYDEAEKRFNELIETDPSTEHAMVGAQMVIAIYEERGELDKVAELSDTYAAKKLGGAKGGEELSLRFKDLKYGALFEKARQLFDEGKYLDSAKEYERIVDENPKFEKIHLALYNAGIAYERLKYYDSAMRLYKRLYTEYNKTDEAVDALFRVGLNAEKFFDFDAAYSSYMEIYSSKEAQYQRYENRVEALRRSAIIKKISNATLEAARLFERYDKEHGSMADAPDLLFEAGMAYERLDNYAEMERVFTLFRRKYGGDLKYRAKVIESYVLQADKQVSRKRGERNAEKLYREALGLYQRSPSAAGADGRYFAAKAQFMLAELAYNEWLLKTLEGKLKVFQANLKSRIDGMKELVEQYRLVWSYNSPEWTMASKYAVGRMFHRMADELDTAKCPSGLDLDTCDGVLGALIEVALSMKEQGVKQYQEVLDFSRQEQLNNKWSRLSTRGMSYLVPQEYSLEEMSEWKAVYSAGPLYDPVEEKRLEEAAKNAVQRVDQATSEGRKEGRVR
ncbi:MAG: tetratricopeptide repeat protein [Bradymonadia bacterium]|jgi:TolA-binding protein